MTDINKKFGQCIREVREEKKKTDPKFSLRQFAQSVGISATFLSKVETDEFSPPSVEKIKLIAKLLDLDADELLALAGKVDQDLPEIIREQPKVVADFLRTARQYGLTEDQFKKLTDKIKKGKL